MPAPIPSVLIPYLQSCLQNGSNTLITSVLDTSANWLIPIFIRAATSDADGENDHTNLNLQDATTAGNSKPGIIFLSFLRSFEFWAEIGKKFGLDLTTLCNRQDVIYIDGLTANINAPSTSKAAKYLKTSSHSIKDISNAIATARSNCSQSLTTPGVKPRLILDGLDFVLASNPDVTALHMTTFITDLSEDFSNIILTAAADGPLLHNIEASATPLEIEHSVLVRTLAHQSDWVLQLRPLETGFARDITGILRVSRGGADSNIDTTDDGSTRSQSRLVSMEWLYHVKGEGGVKIWSRGE